jgi:hypothetical protein
MRPMAVSSPDLKAFLLATPFFGGFSQLRMWERRKWVRLERGGVTLLNPEALLKLAADEIDVAS